MNIYGYKKQIEELNQRKKELEKKANKKQIEKIERAIKIRKNKIKKLREHRSIIKKDKRGKGLFLGLLFAVFFFMIGMWMLPYMKDGATNARTNIDCTNSSISDGAKATCLVVGGGVPYFIIAILAFVGALIGGRL